ncbi:MAG: hypothetical protein VYE22_28305, partial [Myxococcota bacterium]|nr:hypothetical protein [Myxococcota bacterium]
MRSASVLACVALLALGCTLDRSGLRATGADAGDRLDAGRFDGGGRDAGERPDGAMMRPDGGRPDAQVDGGADDAGLLDGGTGDAGTMDAGGDAGPEDGGLDGGGDSGISCLPSPPSCAGDDRIACEMGAVVRTTCRLGCASGACRVLLPSNVGARVAMDAGDAVVSLAGPDPVVFDTGDGSIVQGATVIREASDGEGRDPDSGIYYARLDPSAPTGAPLGVFVMRSLSLASGTTLRGVGARALVLLVSDDAVLDGRVDVSTDGQGGGPGGDGGGGDRSGGGGPGGGGGGSDGSGNDDAGGGGGGHGS